MDTLKTNVLYYGDNLEILRKHISENSIDLVYLDPPFNSKKDYNILFKENGGVESEAQIKAFTDTWHWTQTAENTYHDIVTNGPLKVGQLIGALHDAIGQNDVMAYLVMMATRLIELHRVLKPTGSLYLHCDPTASHYLKLVLDQIFGPANFKNEIIWRRTGTHNATRIFGPIHDVILFYSKADTYLFNVVRRPYMKEHVRRRYREDSDGRSVFSSGGNVLTGAGATQGDSGQPWRGFDPTAKNRHWAVPSFYEQLMPDEYKNLPPTEKLEALYHAGHIRIEPGVAWPVMVRYLDERDGMPVPDIWAYQPYTEGTLHGTDQGIDADVAWMGTTDPERLGYPTQKSEGLLERIIKASSNEGDIVLDPFCGCGTALVAAQKLNRRWIGIDITHLAITLMRNRLRDSFPGIQFEVIGEPVDLASAKVLARQDRYQFQWWALGLIKARPLGEKKKGADKGIDGVIQFIDDPSGKPKRAVVQVKSGHVAVNAIRELKAVAAHDALGIFITLEPPTGPMQTEAVSTGFYHSPGWNKDYPKIQILTIEELLHGKTVDMPPQTQTSVTFTKAPKVSKKEGEQLNMGDTQE
jgi:site-specific DNA-methyltransferase (adenine-specific)